MKYYDESTGIIWEEEEIFQVLSNPILWGLLIILVVWMAA